MNDNPIALLVEDDTAIANFVETVLRANGYKVLQASGGREALSMVFSHCPDVVLLDLGLPDMDGVEIIRAIRKCSEVPVIVVSARSREREKVEALDAGADDYVTKPFGTAELLARMRTALRRIAPAGTRGQDGVFKNGPLQIDMIAKPPRSGMSRKNMSKTATVSFMPSL